MKPQKLVDSYILQKNHHSAPMDLAAKAAFSAVIEDTMTRYGVISEDRMAPGLFPDQPQIPYVLFTPASATQQQPSPVIIHTHGGPGVYFDKHKAHTEIAALLAEGFVVACPNYRGSTSYPEIGGDKAGWEAWESKSTGKHHIYGPEDVYTVAKAVQTLPFVDPKRLTLRGGSFGSHINAFLVAGIKAGKFEAIFNAVHLSGGVKYPSAADFPDDIAILITHAVHDNIAPFADARFLMEKLLLKQLSYEIQGKALNRVQTFISKTGDHHLIDPTVERTHEGTVAYQELSEYLTLAIGFVHAVNFGGEFKTSETYEQFKVVMEHRLDQFPDPATDIVRRVQSYQHMKKTVFPVPASLPLPSSHSSHQDSTTLCPSQALFKLKLGEAYQGDIEKDFKLYLRDHFKPIAWTQTRMRLVTAGKQVIADELCTQQFVSMLHLEQDFLAQHPNHMVLYQAQEFSALALSSFIHLWSMLLRGKPLDAVTVIEEMRLIDFVKQSFDDIQSFLEKFKKRRFNETAFNNISGFAKRAIAANPGLPFNDHSTASNSLWWYFNAEDGERAPVEEVVTDLLNALGLFSAERLNRYKLAIEREKKRLQVNGQKQAMMQQIFILRSTAKAYVGQIWGEEFSDRSLGLDKPEIIATFCKDPVAFEQHLRQNSHAFTNFGDCEGFGDTANGFMYSGLLQFRNLPQQHPENKIVSYFRHEESYHQFLSEFSELVKEDFADYIANRNRLPEPYMQGAAVAKSALQAKLGFFPCEEVVSVEIYYQQQLELHYGLVQNPRKEIYSDITELDKETKIALQKRLRAVTGHESVHPRTLYCLCRYLLGYTYFDLLKEAASAVYLNPNLPHDFIEPYKEDYAELMEDVERFSTMDSIDREKRNIGSNSFDRLCRKALFIRREYEYDPALHEMLQPPSGNRDERQLFNDELELAFECYLQYARLAKELGQGHDITSKRWSLI